MFRALENDNCDLNCDDDDTKEIVSTTTNNDLELSWKLYITDCEEMLDAQQNRYMAYVCTVTFGNDSWSIRRRYNDFFEFHEHKVLERFKESELPSFPGKVC
jgi:hypothetical protein